MTAKNIQTTSAKSPITGHADPEGEAPWAMQVVRVEKSDPPSRTAACAAAAVAVVRLLASKEAAGVWKPQLDRWIEGRIRKHCRRARCEVGHGTDAWWDKAQTLDGVTVEHDGAKVRAFVPCATDQVPVEIGKFQLSGLGLDDPDPNTTVDPDGPVLVVSLQPDPWLPGGKAAVFRCHGVSTSAPVRRRLPRHHGGATSVSAPVMHRRCHSSGSLPAVRRGHGASRPPHQPEVPC